MHILVKWLCLNRFRFFYWSIDFLQAKLVIGTASANQVVTSGAGAVQLTDLVPGSGTVTLCTNLILNTNDSSRIGFPIKWNLLE